MLSFFLASPCDVTEMAIKNSVKSMRPELSTSKTLKTLYLFNNKKNPLIKIYVLVETLVEIILPCPQNLSALPCG